MAWLPREGAGRSPGEDAKKKGRGKEMFAEEVGLEVLSRQTAAWRSESRWAGQVPDAAE